jgi:hypothetical protein
MHGSTPNAQATSAACGVASHALVEATLADIPGLRDAPVPEGISALPPRFLRHCDEQTVVGLRAVLTAIAAHPEPRPSFAGYGVVAAACQSGRIATAQSLAMLRTSGGVAVSPHIVPQCSLHSVAGAVSVALGMHGPNIGASGGQQAVSEGLFTSLSLLAASAVTGESLPGIWLVVSAWTQEPSLDATGKPDLSLPTDAASGPICRALALALTADAHAVAHTGTCRQLTLHMPAAIRIARPSAHDHRAADEILEFARALDAGPAASWSHACPWAAEIRLAPHAAVAGGSQAASRDIPQREAA